MPTEKSAQEELEQAGHQMLLVRKYETRRAHVACLEDQIKGFVEPLQELALGLSQDPTSVWPSRDRDASYVLKGRVGKPQLLNPPGHEETRLLELDIERLRCLLDQLQTAESQREETERCLDKAGLAKYVS